MGGGNGGEMGVAGGQHAFDSARFGCHEIAGRGRASLRLIRLTFLTTFSQLLRLDSPEPWISPET